MSEPLQKKKRGGRREKTTPKIVKQTVSEETDEPLVLRDYERDKEIALRRAVLIERQYILVRRRLKEIKEKEVAASKEAVKAGRCPKFLEDKQLEDEFKKKKNDINQTVYEMKLAQIKDEYEAETQMNKTQFDDQYAYSKGRFIDFFTDLIAEKKRREAQLGDIFSALLLLPPLPTETTEMPVLAEVAYEGRTTRSRSKSLKKEEEEKIRQMNEAKNCKDIKKRIL